MQTNIMIPQDLFIKIARYEIPAFQRPYVWNQNDQWEPLWEDVSGIADSIVATNQPDGHFMGAIVLQQRPNDPWGMETWSVVDGQQRLTTLQLLIDAVQEVCEQQGYQGPADRLLPLVRTPEAFWGGDSALAFKVWPTISDQTAFRHAMQNDLPSDEYKNSRIVAAHNYFKEMTEKWLGVFPSENGQRAAAAAALERAVSRCLELVVISLGTPDDPHIIFQTLNARGTPLLPSDMVKNQILYKAGIESNGDVEEAPSEESNVLWPFEGEWWRQEIGRGHQRRPRIDVYLNNWLTLRNQSEVKAHTEFDAFIEYVKDRETNGATIQDIASDIGKLGNIYQKIDECSLPQIETFLYRRQVLGVGVVIPMLLWLLSSEVPSLQFSKSVTALESYLVRRMACGMSARSYSQLFVGLVAELANSGPEYAGDIVVEYLAKQDAYTNLWPSDEALLDKFLTEPLYWSLTAGRLNLILQGIEGELRTAMTENQAVPRNLNIEHVMPQGWSHHWPLQAAIDNEDAAITVRNRLVHSIGNLTLVTGRLNSSLSNAPWEQKRETLQHHSILFLNKDILENAPSDWDERAIADRAERLHQAAIRVWPHANTLR